MKNYKKLITLMAFVASALATNLPAAAPKKPASAIPAAIQASYAANATDLSKATFEQLKKMKQCNTNWLDKTKTANAQYRSLVFEAATALDHPHPELIMLINNKEDRAAAGGCNINGEEGRGIFINQDELDKDSYGSRRITIYHEVAHLKNRDRTNNLELVKKARQKFNAAIEPALDRYCKHPGNATLKKHYDEEFSKHEAVFKKEIGKDMEDFSYNCEFLADRHAANAAKCEVCARQKGDFFFKYRELQYAGDLQLKELQKMDFNQLTKLIEKLEPQSKAYCLKEKDCHPLCIERAARFYRYALCEGISGEVCQHHKLEAISKAKKKAEQAKQKEENNKVIAFHKARHAAALAKLVADAQAKKDGDNKKTEQPAAGARAAAIPATPKPSPAQVKSEFELYTKDALSTHRYKHKTVDTILGNQVNPQDGWDFEKNNKFFRGEVVSVLRSSGNWTYGVVLHQAPEGITVQLDHEMYKLVLPEVLGKNIG